MAKTKDQLRTENNANFPNNNSQFITPEKIRDYNTDVIDSVALEVNPQLSGEGTFGSLSGSGAVSASTYYGDGSNLTGVIAAVPAGTVSGSSQIILQDTTGDLSSSRIDGQVASALSASFATTASFALNVTPIDTGSFARTDVANNFTGSNNTFPMQFDLRPTNSAPNDDSRFRFDSFQNRMQISLVSDDTFFDREIRFYPSASYAAGFPQDSELGLKITEDGVFGFGNKLSLTNTSGENLGTFEISGSDSGDSYVTYLGDTKVMEYNYDADFIIHNNINARGGIDARAKSTFFEGIEILNGFTASLAEGYAWVGNGDGVATAYSTGSLNFALTNVNNTFTGTQNFNNISVSGTGSFAYIESVTGSAKIIGDAFIILNNNTPSERYAGIAVQDSGSAGVTASFQFDGLNNDWFYEYSDDGGVTTDHGVALFGPEYNTIGSPTYLSDNTIPKGDGGHHLNDSSITDIGSQVIVANPLDVQGNITTTGTVDGVDIQSLDSQVNTNTNDIVSLKLATSSLETSVNALNSYTQSTDGRLTNIELTTASFDGRLNNIELTTASLDSSISQLNTFSGSTEGRLNNIELATGSYATTGANTFTGLQTISGSSAYEVISPSIASLTASIDFVESSIQTLTLVSGSDTHIVGTNVDKGQTINLLVKQPAVGTGSLSFSPDFLQATGSEYTPTPTSDAKDILTFITFDSTTEIYVSNITELV